MKKIITIMSLLCLVLLGACTTNNSTDSKEKVDNVKQTVEQSSNKENSIVVNNIKMSVTQDSTAEVKKGKKTEKLYTFDIKGTNVGATPVGLGSIDFVLKTKDNKEITVDTSMSSFGNEIKKDKSLQGKAYFSVDKDVEVKELVYKPAKKVLNTWKVKNN